MLLYESMKDIHKPVETSDVLEIKHISLNKGVFNFLVGPRDKQFVILGCFVCQTRREIDGDLETIEQKHVSITLLETITRQCKYKKEINKNIGVCC